MWIPRSAAELVAALADVQESAILEFKRELPLAGRNEDIAVDVAAMSTDGGVIVYGVEEDKAAGAFTPRPFALAGAVERISNVVRSSIGNAPAIDAFTLDEDGGHGFVVVVVPLSPLAPHQVLSNGHMRFYGRAPAETSS